MTLSAAEAPSSTATREKILDAAELLFIERGFTATSLRAIASKAGVNLAATHYHFGSKNGLLAAVFHRRVAPINEQRLADLQQLRASNPTPPIRDILAAFYGPFMRPDLYEAIPAVIGQIYGEPDTITKPIIESEFSEVFNAFEAALSAALPQVDRAELRWRMHFMIGSMLHLLRMNSPLGIEPSRASFLQGLEKLIDFSMAGLEQADSGAPHD